MPLGPPRRALILAHTATLVCPRRVSHHNLHSSLCLALDTESQLLPSLPAATPRDVHRRPDEAEYQINTSALRRAFPDFSQYGSSDEDSLEIGRGLARNDRRSLDRILPSGDPSENISLNFGNEKFTVTGTPPIKPRNNKTSMTAQATSGKAPLLTRANSEKENAHPLAKTTDYVSSMSSRGSNGKRQALGELQASVESDDSISLTGERPKAATLSSKNTRFNNSRTKQPLAEAMSTPNARMTSHAMNNGTLNSVNSAAANGTFQSFALPDLPNITELVSGQRTDGTPLYPKSAKSRSRFVGPSSFRKSQTGKSSHVSIDNVPVPIDAKALYISLQILQEKYIVLEQEKAQAVEKADSYELECLQLKSKAEEQADQIAKQHSDSGVDIDDDDGKTRERGTERSQFEASIKSLQSRLNRANKKVSESEATIQHLTKDRDAAHQQLALAFVNSEELKNEGQAVREEIETVKSQLVKVTRQHERRIEKLTRQETELRGKIERREKAVNEMAALAKELWNTRNAFATKDVSEGRKTGPVERPAPREDLQQSSRRASRASRHKSFDNFRAAKPLANVAGKIPNDTTTEGHRRRPSSRQSQHAAEPENQSEIDLTTQLDLDLNLTNAHAHELTKDDTYLSFMEGDEVAKLRRIVEQDKARLAQAGVNVEALISHETLSGALQTARHPAIPRKSSLKALPGRSQTPNQIDNADDGTRENLTTTSRHSYRTAAGDGAMHDDGASMSQQLEKDDTRQSLFSQRSEARRRSAGRPADEMTSALIVPDITFAGAALFKHDGQSNGLFGTKQTTTISRPVPVSDRKVQSTVDNEDPTLRPSRSPAVALAAVLHGLENEIDTLRQHLTKYEELYNQHDPSLSKCKRKAVYARMQKLLAAIEVRADQVYALYDVLEGQKESGQLMNEEEIEVTLHSLGIQVEHPQEKKQKSTAGPKQTKKKTVVIDDDKYDSGSESDLPFEQPSDDEQFDEYEDNDMPWEGIEATQTQTLGSLRGLSASASAAAGGR